MMLDFNVVACQTQSSKHIFGLCDNPAPAKDPAYIDEQNGSKWIAVVENEDKHQATFTAIDNCINISGDDGKMARRCDGMLTYKDTVIFVELKQRSGKGIAWVKDAIPQLQSSIQHFEQTEYSGEFRQKKAYVANSEHPKFKASQIGRMESFYQETGYVLRIEARIRLV